MGSLIIIIATRLMLHLGLQRLLRSRCERPMIEAHLGALLLGQMVQIVLMLTLSLFGWLSAELYLPLYAAVGITVLVWEHYHRPPQVVNSAAAAFRHEPVDIAIYAVFGAMLGLVFWRAIFFFDTTYDVLTYGLSKIALYLQDGSVFHLTGLADLRIDANERNGELLFLHYLLAGDDLRWMALGGVESWLTLWLAAWFLVSALGASPRTCAAAALLTSSSPLLFGLSGVTKGDALAIAWIVASSGWLLQRRDNFSFFFFWVALAHAVNCKISAAFPGLGLVLVQALALLRERRLASIGVVLATGAATIICFSKPIQNALAFGRPFLRTSHESDLAGFSWGNTIEALQRFPAWFLGIQPDNLPWGSQGDLGKSLGLAGIASLCALGVFARFRSRSADNDRAPAPKSNVGAALVAMALGTLTLFSIMPVYDPELDLHSYRFGAPAAVATILVLIALGASAAPTRIKAALPLLLVAASGWHWLCDTNASPTLSHYGRRDLVGRLFNYDRTKARFGYWMSNSAMPQNFVRLQQLQQDDRDVGIILTDGNAPLAWALGDRLNWRPTHFFLDTDSVSPATADVSTLVVVSYREPLDFAAVQQSLGEGGWQLSVSVPRLAVYERPL
ncbi:MAG TPA: hypothetical protein VGD88_05380 [Opitutaceae bacterium]